MPGKSKRACQKEWNISRFFGGVLWKKRNIPSVMKLIFDWNRIWRAAEMGFSACLWELVSACLAKNWHWARIIEHSSCPFMMQKFLTFFHRWLDITPDSNFQPKSITTSELNQQEWFVILNQFGLRAIYNIALDFGMYVNKWRWWKHRAIYNLMCCKFNVMPCKMAFCSIFISLFSKVYCVLCLGVAEYKRLAAHYNLGFTPRDFARFPPFCEQMLFLFYPKLHPWDHPKNYLKPSKKQVVGLKSTI